MYRIGIDLGGTFIKAGLVDENWNITAQISKETRSSLGAMAVVSDMIDCAKELMEDNQIAEDQILSIGIGAPGLIDTENGIVKYSNNLDWLDVPVAECFSKVFHLPVSIANDADAAAMGEVKAGAARGKKNVILLTLGTGVGGGIVLNGKLFTGSHAGGAELGHTSLKDGLRACTCGRKGCLEAYASATGLIQTMKEQLEKDGRKSIPALDGKTIFSLAAAGDESAAAAIEQYTDELASGIANYINIFRPDVILLGGGISHAGRALFDPVNAKVKDLCFGSAYSFVPEVEPAQLGNDAGILGAAAL